MFGRKKHKIEESVKQEQPSKEKLLGTIRPSPNHRLYEINMQELSIKVATFEEKKALRFHGGENKKRKVKVNKHCVYIPAMNVKNAKKRAKRDLGMNVNHYKYLKG